MASAAQPAAADAVNKLRIPFSPYLGDPDFELIRQAGSRSPIDQVAVADLLRNAFVYPPHSIFENLKLATYGFNQTDDMAASPRFQFKFMPAGPASANGNESMWVQRYHELLRDAVRDACESLDSPWLLQSGGKDSTSIAIAAADARPDITCLTYLGGREENEVESAVRVAKSLGLRHEALICDPGRAYDRYLAMVDAIPLLTGDFALLSYADIVTEISQCGGDGVLDGLGSDVYFGTLVGMRDRILKILSLDLSMPVGIHRLPLVTRSFRLNFALATLQMNSIERVFPGSRFTDLEVDALFGREISRQSRQRIAPFLDAIAMTKNLDERRAVTLAITEPMEAFAKGLYTTAALSLKIGYPYCNEQLRTWVQNEVPRDLLVDSRSRTSKVLVRKHIASRFGDLPYVTNKGSFRFDVCGLASRFDQVYDFSLRVRDFLPGAPTWLLQHRHLLGNKYHASKFYLLAVVLPWLLAHGVGAAREADARAA